jgi:hypothetical protein
MNSHLHGEGKSQAVFCPNEEQFKIEQKWTMAGTNSGTATLIMVGVIMTKVTNAI